MEALPVSPFSVFLYALLTAVATGLGALPFLFTRGIPRRYLGLANAAAAGLMVAASFGLVYEGVGYSLGRTLLGVGLGLIFILLSHRYLEGREVSFGELKGLDARKALMMVGIMTLHSFAEGVGVGVAFGGGEALGVFISLAIAVHNIPEGLAISLVLVPRGVSVLGAAFWSVFSSLPQPLMAVPAFLFVEAFRPALPIGLGFAAGAMIWMAVAEILPEALKEAEPEGVATVLTLAVALMVAFQILLGGEPDPREGGLEAEGLQARPDPIGLQDHPGLPRRLGGLEEGPVRGVQGKGLGQGVLDEPNGEGPVPLPGQGGEEAEVARPPRGGGVGEEGEGPLQPVRVLGLKEGLPSPHPGPEVQPFPL